MSHEVRIGLLAFIAIAMGLWGIKFIQGSNILKRSDTYHVYYSEVGGVNVGTSVKIRGVSVGSVSAVSLNVENRQVKVSFTMSRDVPLPKNTKAILSTTGIMGDKNIILEYGDNCTGDNCAQDGDVFEGHFQGMVESMVGKGGIEGYIDELKKAILELTDSLNKGMLDETSDNPLAKTMRDLQASMSNMKELTGRFSSLVQRTAPSMEQSLGNINQLTETLSAQRQHIAGIISNVDSLSNQIVDSQLDQAIADIKTTIQKLNQTMDTADTALLGVSMVMDKVQKGEGSLGKLIQDESLYNNLNAMSYSLDSLLSDFQNKPYRYMPLKSRRKVQKYDKQDEN